MEHCWLISTIGKCHKKFIIDWMGINGEDQSQLGWKCNGEYSGILNIFYCFNNNAVTVQKSIPDSIMALAYL